jgi:glutathione S-transferase
MHAIPTPITFKGAPGSPYTRKMQALLRYRHIPYRYLIGNRADLLGLPKPRVELLPTFYLPNGDGLVEAVTDSTPLIRRFENAFADRSVRPPQPALAFLDSLLEDFADEWVTRMMFHYRWHYAADADKAGTLLPMQFMGICQPDSLLKPGKTMFSQRQISRLGLVGSNPTSVPMIEHSYSKLLDLFDAHLREYPFLLGARPASADFALYGQLSQLAAFDQTSATLTLARAPRVMAWSGLTEDLSGLDPQDTDWFDPTALPQPLLNLLHEVGRGYVPHMLANARAVGAGEKQVHTQIDDQPWTLQAVPYQAKCVRWLREEYAALPATDKALVHALLERTGCAALVDETLPE